MAFSRARSIQGGRVSFSIPAYPGAISGFFATPLEMVPEVGFCLTMLYSRVFGLWLP